MKHLAELVGANMWWKFADYRSALKKPAESQEGLVGESFSLLGAKFGMKSVIPSADTS